jgi:aerobic carbon-monoxide dehydrogenase small subunit
MRPAAPRVVVRFTVNGVGRRVRVPPMARLLDVLREECGLTGTKEGCGEGECGACTVLVDGAAVDACLVPVAHAEGTHVTTIEGAGRRRAGRTLQRSFERHGAAQCGICTPGMIVAAMPIRRGSAAPAIAAALSGNLCRCTGYASIFRAVEEAVQPPAAARRTRARTPAGGRTA